MVLKPENVNNKTSINKIIDMNFIKNKFAGIDIVGKKQILRVLNVLLLFSPKKANGIDNNQYTGSMSVEQIFKVLTKQNYDKTDKKHKGTYKNIEAQLNKLSNLYNSMYGDRNLIGTVEKNGITYYYLTNFRKQYHALNYVNLDLGTLEINIDIINKYNLEISDLLTAAIIYEITKFGVVFSYGQIENIFGISKNRIKKAFENFEIITINSRRTVSKSEAKQIGFNARITEGNKMYSCSGKHIDFLNELNINFNYSRLIDLRIAIIENKQYIKNVFLNKVNKEITVEEYEKFVKENDVSVKSTWYRIDTDMSKGKMIAMQNVAYNGTKDWDYEKNHEEILERKHGKSDCYKLEEVKKIEKTYEDKIKKLEEEIKQLKEMKNKTINEAIDSPEEELDENNEVDCTNNINTFVSPLEDEIEDNTIKLSEMYEIMQNHFEDFLEKYHKHDDWVIFMPAAVEYLENPKNNFSEKNRQHCINLINAIKTPLDIMTSPILCKNWLNNSSLEDVVIMMNYRDWLRSFLPYDIKDISRVDKIVFNYFKNDIANYTEDLFYKKFVEVLGCEITNEEIFNYTEHTMFDLKRLKNRYEADNIPKDNTVYSAKEILNKYLNDSEDIKSWLKYLKDNMNTSENESIKNWLNIIQYNIRLNNYSIIKEILPKSSETKIYGILLDEIKKQDTNKIDERMLIMKKLSEKGYNILNSNALEKDIMKISIEYRMNDISIDDAIQQYLIKQ